MHISILVLKIVGGNDGLNTSIESPIHKAIDVSGNIVISSAAANTADDAFWV